MSTIIRSGEIGTATAEIYKRDMERKTGEVAVAELFRYLVDAGNFERFSGICPCYVCKQIRDDFEPWKLLKSSDTP